MSTTVQDVCRFLDEFAPTRLAEDWDNVGLLVGDRSAGVRRVMTCLTVTPTTTREAIDREADLIVSHHPMPFRPLKQITTDTTPGRILWELIGANVAVYSPHTGFDSAATGINQQFAEGLGLTDIRPLIENPETTEGSGRWGKLADPQATGAPATGAPATGAPAMTPFTLSELAGRLCEFLQVEHLKVVGPSDAVVRNVAVACGSAGSFLEPAGRAGCDVLITGETTFHTCLEAAATGIHLLLPGHFASERFAVERLAQTLGDTFPSAEVWASVEDRDPVRWYRSR